MQATGPASPLLDPQFVATADNVQVMVLVRQLMGRRNEKRKIEARELKKKWRASLSEEQKEEERAKRRARNKRNYDNRNEQQKARQTSHRKKYRDRLRAEGKAVK